LNQLALARIASCVATSLILENTTDGVAAKAVLENLLEKKDRLGSAASLYASAKLGLLTLALMERLGAMDEKALGQIKEMLKANKVTLGELADGDTAVVHSAYYECAMTYRKAVGPPEAYYREAIQYLAYTSLDALTPQKRIELATDLCVAALTGEGVYNFGEVAHNNAAILAALEGTPNHWLVKLIHASADGDVQGLDQITTDYEQQIQDQPALLNRAVLVKEKIALLALVNMVFQRKPSDRTLNFKDIAERIQMPEDQVELVIIRALSLGLIKGSMDQVDGTVHVTWVMPRVLDNNQLTDLAQRFGEWAVKVSKTKDFMGEHIPAF
jgi:26S proteasome regulatory subunit N9